jgi:hypothetical protein
MNARESENYLAISRSTSASKSVEIFWTGICRRRLFFRAESSLIQSNCRSLGTDHLTWRGGVMVFCFVQNFFLGQHESDYYFFLSHKVQFFFPEFHIGYMTKTLNQIIFFPLPKSEYFVQQHWESEFFLEKNHRVVTVKYKTICYPFMHKWHMYNKLETLVHI